MEYRLVLCLLLSCSVMRAASKNIYRDIENGTDASVTHQQDTTTGYEEFTTESSSGNSSQVVCGRTSFTEETGKISSPGYPDTYPNNANCRYHIQAAGNKVIKLTFRNFSIEESGYGDCVYDSLTIHNGNENSVHGLCKLCGPGLPNVFIVPSNSALLVFTSDYTVRLQGFELRYEVVDRNSVPANHENTCRRQPTHPTTEFPSPEPSTENPHVHCGGDLTEETGEITSPGYPMGYQNNIQHCEWNIQAQNGKKVELTFNHFDLEHHPTCHWDDLTIINEGQSGTNSIKKLCGCYSQYTYVSTSNNIRIKFKTDSSVTASGFSITYRSVNQNTLGTEPIRCNNNIGYPTGGPDYTTDSSTGNNSTGMML